MNELVKINYKNDRPTVSGRDLHSFIEVDTPYRLWFPRMCEYGFAEMIDYTPYNFVHPKNNQEVTDHELTIEMAKELCMLQRNEKGKQARQYFIQLEKDWNSPEKVMARALQIADRKIHSLVNKIEQDKPKTIFADAVAASKSSILIGELAKVLKQNNIDMGQNRLFEWFRDNGYLIKRKGEDWNLPTQRSMDMKLFEIKKSTHLDGNGCSVTTRTTKVTGKGQMYFVNLFLNKPQKAS